MGKVSIFDKWRSTLMRANLIILLSLPFIEAGMYVVMEKTLGEADTVKRYFAYYVCLPFVCNISCWLIGMWCIHSTKWSERSKNYIPFVCMTGICTVIACIHTQFTVTLGFFSLVVVMSGIFSDVRLAKHIAVLCIVMSCLSAIFAQANSQVQSNWYLLNVFISEIYLVVTYFCSKIVIHYSKEQINMMKKSYNRVGLLKQNLKRDCLTGLYNQASFVQELEDSVSEAQRTHEKLTLVVIDIDDFKKVNDTYGHGNGNVVLVKLSQVLEACCGNTGYVCRYGGEEFSIIFKGLGEDETFQIMERARTMFMDTRYSFACSRQVTFSCGIQQYYPGVGKAKEFFEKADKAMYTAKRNGKNRCIKGVLLDGTENMASLDTVLTNQIDYVKEKYSKT